MRIAIDARMMGAENTRGIGRYIEEIVRAMLDVAPEHRYVLIVSRKSKVASQKFSGSVETIEVDIPWYGLAEQRKMPSVLRSANADVVHVPHWNVPYFFRGPLVVTIHDLLLRHEPASAKASTKGIVTRMLKRIGYRLTLDHAIRAARMICVPTRSVADDVASFYPRSMQKIIVTGEGMPPVILAKAGIQDEKEFPNGMDSRLRGNDSRSYLLYVGSAYPHKGLADLLLAWETISKTNPTLNLFIAGEMDVFMSRVKTEAEKKGLPRIEFLGRVDEMKLADLYRNALAFVYPTHFEGFGLPPLEAISHGCPVISSDAGPLREVLGSEGVIFFRTGDANGMIQAVTRVVDDPETARQNVRSAAVALAERHDWKRAARATLEAYERTMTQASHGTQSTKDIG